MKEDFVGKQFTTNKSGVCVVTKYVRADEVYVKFDKSGYETCTTITSLRKGNVKDKTQVRGGKRGGLITKEDVSDLFEIVEGHLHWKKSITDKRAGFLVLNKHKAVSILGRVYHFDDVEGLMFERHKEISPNSLPSPEGYSTWNAMQSRCKDKGYPISELFSKYETWLDWVKTQKGYGQKDFFGNTFNLDSDLFSNGEKTYSEDTCVFIPLHINQVYKTSYKSKEIIGVGLKRGRYQARICVFNTQVNIGTYETEELANEAYISKRSEYIKILLEMHRHQLADKTIKFLEDDIVNNIFI